MKDFEALGGTAKNVGQDARQVVLVEELPFGKGQSIFGRSVVTVGLLWRFSPRAAGTRG
jgi:hypothetical protein